MSLEQLLGSKGKIKILRVLARLGEANITRIAKETSLHHKYVERHLAELARMGIVSEKRIGRVRIYSLRIDNPKVLTLLDLLRALEEAGPHDSTATPNG